MTGFKVGLFEKVSYEQFAVGMKDEFGERFSDDDIENIYYGIQLPKRGTRKSAGYDFFAPFSFELAPGQTIKIPTGIRVHIDEGWFLGCYPRSGLGFKHFATLANTVGIIDADYSEAKNEGHIFFKIVNRTPPGSPVPRVPEDRRIMHVNQGDGFAQGIFQPFGITYDDCPGGERTGGFGSTTKE